MKRKPYVDPVRLVIQAARQAERLRHETYSIDLLHRIVEHNQTELVPALSVLMQWALDLRKEVHRIDAKLLRHDLPGKSKGGRHASKSR